MNVPDLSNLEIDDHLHLLPKPQFQNMTQAAAGECKTIYESIEAALKRRAVKLNNYDVHGRATVIPEYMLDLGKNKNGNDKPTQLILLSIEHDFYELSKQIKATLLYNKRNRKKCIANFFGYKKNIAVGFYLYREFQLLWLLLRWLFLNVADDVIHHQTNHILILHIHSVQRVQEMFTISNLCAVKVETEEN